MNRFQHFNAVRRINGIDIIADGYIFSHGNAPRGQGSWAFSPLEDIDSCDKRIIWKQGIFGDARKAAALDAKVIGLNTLFVLA